MGGKGLGLLVLFWLLLAPASAHAGCPCPKSKMVELYGSVSMIPPKLPGPRVDQGATSLAPLPVRTTALPSMADVIQGQPTPLLDLMANPLLWDPIFVQQ